jgi:hypothetical protein
MVVKRTSLPRLVLLGMAALAFAGVLSAPSGFVLLDGSGVAFARGGGGGGAGPGGGDGGMVHGPGDGQGMGQGQGMEQGQGMMNEPMMDRAQHQDRSMSMDAASIRGVQHALNHMGYHAGPEDGMMGPNTRSAIAAFQAHHGMEADGHLSHDLAARIRSQAQQGSPSN